MRLFFSALVIAFVFSIAFSCPARAGRRTRAVEISLARSAATLDARSKDPYANALGAELVVARTQLSSARSALAAHRVRRARELARGLDEQLERVGAMLRRAAESSREWASAAEDFARCAEAEEGAQRGRVAALDARGAQLTGAFPPLEPFAREDAEVERIIEASRRRAARAESAREAAHGADPKVRAARLAVGRGIVSRARREAEAVSVLAEAGEALEAQSVYALGRVREAEEALGRADLEGAERSAQRVTRELCRVMTWAFEGEGEADAVRRVDLTRALVSKNLVDVASSCGVALPEVP